jgi:hypothetical protein
MPDVDRHRDVRIRLWFLVGGRLPFGPANHGPGRAGRGHLFFVKTPAVILVRWT